MRTKLAIQTLLLFSIGLTPVYSQDKKNEASDVISFKNNDTLHGRLVLISSQADSLTWKHSDSPEPFTFSLKTLKSITLEPSRGKPAGNDSTCSVTLTNGDILKGDMTVLDSETLNLKTWYAGEIKIRRTMIKEIACSEYTRILYSGPDGINEWLTNNKENPEDGPQGGITFNNNSLIFEGEDIFAEKKDLSLPDMVRIEFDTTLKCEYGFNVILYSDKKLLLDRANNLNSAMLSLDAYCIGVSKNEIQISRLMAGREDSSEAGLDNEKLASHLMNSAKANINIFVNRKTGTLNLYIDNMPAVRFTDKEKECPRGVSSCLHPPIIRPD